jgi:hypothetical protein
MQMDLKQVKAVELGCMVTAQGGNVVSVLGSTQYSRQKCMPLRQAWLRT